MKKNHLLLALLMLAFFYGRAQSKFTRTITSTSQALYWYSAKQTADGGYISMASAIDTGVTRPWSIFLAKLNMYGDTLWTNAINANSDLNPNAIEEAADGFIISVNNSSYGAGSWDIMLIKTDTAGNFQWAKT